MAREGFANDAGESIEGVEAGHGQMTRPFDAFFAMDGEEERFTVTFYVLMSALCLDLLKSRER